MNDSEPFQRASAAALRYLSHRPRSEAEVRTRLARRFPPNVVDSVIEELSLRGLTDDSKFAALWADSRSRHSPRSAFAIRRELTAKGVSQELADSAIRDIDDRDAAYTAGAKHARRLGGSDHAAFRRRMWGYLRRRGFSPSISRSVIAHLWDERRGERSEAQELSAES